MTTTIQLPLPGLGADDSAEAAAAARRRKPLRQEWTPELLGRECLLTPADLTQIMGFIPAGLENV